MKKMTRICWVIVVCLLSINSMGGYMQGFVDMEDFASLSGEWQDPLQLADLESLAINWMTYQVAEPSLAWWKLEETTGATAYDSTGNGYDLLPQSGFVISDATTGGKINNGMMFPGTGARLTQATLLEEMPKSLTIAAWVRPDATGMSAGQCWLSKQNATSNGQTMWLKFNMASGAPGVIGATISSSDTTSLTNLNSNIIWQDDTWYHYVFTWDSNGARLYINGELESSNSEPIMKDGTQWDLSIASGGSTSQPFKGVIDDVRIYNSILSAADIKSLYNSTSGFVTYPLIVHGGTGSGIYLENTIVDITANASSTGQAFDVWAGGTKHVTDINDLTTTVTMPESAVTVTAAYQAVDLYALTVNHGTGTGSYVEGLVVNIAANTSPAGQAFDVWVGDTLYVTDVSNPTTTVTMPASAVTLTAAYKVAIPHTLTVNNGTGGGEHILHTVVNIAANTAVAGEVFDAWTGDTEYVTDISDSTTTVAMPESAVTLTATYKERGPVTIMPLGDSITSGYSTFSCYRPILGTQLNNLRYTVEFVGSQFSNVYNESMYHEGHSGATAATLAANFQQWYTTKQADIILLHAGHNYYAENNPVDDIVNANRSIIVTADSINSEVVVVLAKVITSSKLPKYSYIPQLNEALEQLAAELTSLGYHVILVDQAAGFDPYNDTVVDNVHPNASGAQKMSDKWLQALTTIIATD